MFKTILIKFRKASIYKLFTLSIRFYLISFRCIHFCHVSSNVDEFLPISMLVFTPRDYRFFYLNIRHLLCLLFLLPAQIADFFHWFHILFAFACRPVFLLLYFSSTLRAFPCTRSSFFRTCHL